MKHFVLFVLLVCTGTIMWAQPFQVGSSTQTFTDPARNNRSIPTNIYYPATSAGNGAPLASGEFPVVVFGHGFLMSPTAYSFLWNALVPLGYIVCLPDTETGLPPSHPNFGADLAFIAELFLNNPPGFFAGSVKASAALMGHSMGGGCSMLGAENNPLITTTVTFAAADTNPSSIAAAAQVTAPSLFIAGAVDCVTPTDPEEHFNNSGGSYRVYTEIANGTHCKFADNNFTCNLGEFGCPNSIPRATQHAQTLALVIPWLGYYLKDDCAAWPEFEAALGAPPYLSTQAGGLPPLEEPIISLQGNELELNVVGLYSYQWYLDGVAIPGANGASYLPLENGAYTVEIENGKGCTLLSAPFTLNVMPVDWLYFRVYPEKAARGVAVQWGTASEENANFFEVQRSSDGVNFRALGQVNARGTTQVPQDYYFQDARPLPGWSYYRLRQQDMDGTAVYSQVMALHLATSAGIELVVWPNPWSGGELVFQVDERVMYNRVVVRDMLGRIVWQQALVGGAQQTLQIAELPVGLYALCLYQGVNLVANTLVLRSEQ